MTWNIAQAKQQFSEVVRLSVQEPQAIYNRERCVAAVIDAETFAAFEAWRKQTQRKTLGEEFAELRALAAAEDYQLPVMPRSDSGRANPFAAALAEYDRPD